MLSIFLLYCEKELNISEFIDDYNLYTPELRIEALILPNDSTAIVRIDRSFPSRRTFSVYVPGAT